MDDNFLHDLRREPAPEFARRLRVSLRDASPAARGVGLGQRASKWATLAASIALVSLAFTFPSVRAGAQAFLDLFRVVNLAGVSFDAERFGEVEFGALDLPRMLGEQVEVLTEPQTTLSFDSPDDAGAAAGLRVLEPAWLPVGWEREGIEVSGAEALRVTANTSNLRQLLELLAIDDLSIPFGLDGQTATLRVPPVVTTTYSNGERQMQLVQARTPEVSFPAGLDLPVLAEIGLRILGLDREEAYRLAWTIDWRSTLVVPVPLTEGSFRQVNVAGRDGLLIESRGRERNNSLLWTSDDRVFALNGPLQRVELLEIAQTTQ